MLIEIDDRLYNDFVNWAKANNIPETDFNKYIIKAFRDRFMIDKYGDLNDKFRKKTEEPKDKPVPVNVQLNINETVHVNETKDESVQNEPERPKRGRPRKQVIQSK